MHKRDLRSIPHPMEHALAEEGAPERNPVKTAHQVFTFVNLDTMAVAPLVEFAVEHADAGIDPGARPTGLWLGTALEHCVEIPIDGDGETVGAHRACEPAGHVEAIEGNEAAFLRPHPEKAGIVRALRLGKLAAAKSLKQ